MASLAYIRRLLPDTSTRCTIGFVLRFGIRPTSFIVQRGKRPVLSTFTITRAIATLRMVPVAVGIVTPVKGVSIIDKRPVVEVVMVVLAEGTPTLKIATVILTVPGLRVAMATVRLDTNVPAVMGHRPLASPAVRLVKGRLVPTTGAFEATGKDISGLDVDGETGLVPLALRHREAHPRAAA